MIPLLTAIMLASLLGSAHCAGMCGAFAAFAVGSPGRANAPSPWALSGAYNLGRLVVYTVLGALAGGAGAAVDLGGSMLGVQRVAAVLAGAMMAGFGVIAILRLRGVRVPRAPIPGPLLNLARAGHGRALRLSPLARAGAVGLLTTLLPCGWLYAFVITSAGTGSPLRGAACMAVFWLGTLPIMSAVGLGVQRLTGPLRRHLPLATSLFLVVTGLLTIFGRLALPAAAAPARTPHSIEEAVESVEHADEVCPLCHPGGD